MEVTDTIGMGVPEGKLVTVGADPVGDGVMLAAAEVGVGVELFPDVGVGVLFEARAAATAA